MYPLKVYMLGHKKMNGLDTYYTIQDIIGYYKNSRILYTFRANEIFKTKDELIDHLLKKFDEDNNV
jgi:hypothetical protein